MKTHFNMVVNLIVQRVEDRATKSDHYYSDFSVSNKD